MKHVILLMFFSLHAHASTDYEQNIHQHAENWKISYIQTLQDRHQLQTLIDVILLSYQIAQESCIMMLSKMIMQEEILKIYTPSLNDSWHTNLQVIHNNSNKLEQALEAIKFSQNRFQIIFEKLKNIAPRIISINPQPTQILIQDLKHSLMIWGKQQHEITAQLCCLQQEFSSAIATISDVKIMFETLGHAPELKNCHLKEAAGYFAKTNKDIESVFAHVTQIRKTSVIKIQTFFTTFFKIYYQMLYDLLTPEEQINFSSLATHDLKLPNPDAFFI